MTKRLLLIACLLGACLVVSSCRHPDDDRPPPVPDCVAVSPDAGPLGGGNHVEVTSLGECLFGPNTELKFGEHPAIIIDILSPTELIAEVPPGNAPGLVDVVLIGEDHNGNVCECRQEDAYFYEEPPPVHCLTVDPDGGPLTGGNQVEIHSGGICLFGPNTQIWFGANQATIIDILSPTVLVAEVPAGDAPGLVDVSMIGEDNAGAICDCREPDAYLYHERDPVHCLTVSPDAGPLAGGNQVEIHATGDCVFGPNTEIFFGGKPATIIDILSATALVAEVPPGDAPGHVDVSMIGVDHAGAVCDCVQPDAYFYKEPDPVRCLGVTPEAGPLAGGNLVEVHALGSCLFGHNTEIWFGAHPATIVDIISPTELVAEVPPGDAPGAVDVKLIGVDHAGAVCDCVEPGAYVYREPDPVRCLTVSPEGGPLAGGNLVEIHATGDCFFDHNTEIWFGAHQATIVDILSATALVAEVPPGDAPGHVDVSMIGVDHAGAICDCTEPDAYFYKEPDPVRCLKVSPEGGPLAGGNLVEIHATGDCFFGHNTEIWFGAHQATIVDILSDTALVAEVPPGAAPGHVDVSMIGVDHAGAVCDCTEPDAYFYRELDPVRCLAVSPDGGPIAGGNQVEIHALGDCLFGPNTEIKFGTNPAIIIDIISPTALIAEVPPGNAPGPVDVSMVGEDANGHVCDCSENDAYVYHEPDPVRCLSVSPEKGPLAGGNQVEIHALGDCLFGPNTEIKFGANPAIIIDVISPTALVAEVPAGDAPGFVDVILIGEDANGRLCDCAEPDAYFYEEPDPLKCLTVTPAEGPLAGGNHVEITSGGICFFGPNTEIKFGANPAIIIDVISPTELIAEVPAGDAPGLVDVILIGEDNAGAVCDCVQNDAYLYLR